MTPVAMLAGVNADTPYKSMKDYINAVKDQPGNFKTGGTGSKQEVQNHHRRDREGDRHQALASKFAGRNASQSRS
jgi:hypothetical protein